MKTFRFFAIFGMLAAVATLNSFASEPRVYWTHVDKQFLVGTSGLDARFDAELKQIKEWTESVPYQDTCYRDGYIETPGTCEGYHCAQSGNGKSELWDAFYSAPNAKKADALAKAIKGVGDATAKKLVAADYFHRKPRSWDAFSNEIEDAARAGVIDEQIVYMVLVKYKADNLTNLGYEAGQCTTYTYPCTVYTPGTIPYSCTKYRDETYSRVIDSTTRRVSINVQNAVLQSFETDTANISIGNEVGDVQVRIGPYNKYNVAAETSFGTTHIRATGVQRNLVDLPREVVRSATFEKQGGQAVFKLNIDSRYLGDGQDQLVLKYSVHSCKMNFFSVCLGSYTPGVETVVPLKQAETSITIPLMNKMRSKVVYSLARKGSRWYNDNFISVLETKSVNPK